MDLGLIEARLALAVVPLLPLAGEGARRADEGVFKMLSSPAIAAYPKRFPLPCGTNTLIRPVGHLLPQAGEGEMPAAEVEAGW